MSTTSLPILFCLIVEFPEGTNTDCEPNGTVNETNCFKCDIPGKYLFSGDVPLGEHGHGSAGHVICLVLWICLVIMGVFGTFANGFVITVLRKRKSSSSFDVLLYVLAGFDLINSLATLISGTGIIFYLENWNSRGLPTLASYYISILVYFFGKSGSSYITVLITLERYLVISNPIKSRAWFTPIRTKVMIVGLILLATMFNIPRCSSIGIRSNSEEGQRVQSLADKKYIIYSTWLYQIWYGSLKSAHFADAFAPFPLLLIFHILLFVKISKFTKMRQRLTKKQKSDIRAARMFFPVVVVLFLCNVIPISHYIAICVYRICHRELFLGMLLSVAVNSAANLPIYYARGGSFREEIRSNLPEWLRPWFNKIPQTTPAELTPTGEDNKAETPGTTDSMRFGEYFLPFDGSNEFIW